MSESSKADKREGVDSRGGAEKREPDVSTAREWSDLADVVEQTLTARLDSADLQARLRQVKRQAKTADLSLGQDRFALHQAQDYAEAIRREADMYLKEALRQADRILAQARLDAKHVLIEMQRIADQFRTNTMRRAQNTERQLSIYVLKGSVDIEKYLARTKPAPSPADRSGGTVRTVDVEELIQEVTEDISLIMVGDSTGGQMLFFTRSEWQTFIAGVKAGDFDLDSAS